MGAPQGNRHSSLPVPASSASSQPSLVPPKTRPPAVAISPAQGGERSGNSQAILPVADSSARIAPEGSMPARPRMPPAENQRPGWYSAASLKKTSSRFSRTSRLRFSPFPDSRASGWGFQAEFVDCSSYATMSAAGSVIEST